MWNNKKNTIQDIPFNWLFNKYKIINIHLKLTSHKDDK